MSNQFHRLELKIITPLPIVCSAFPDGMGFASQTFGGMQTRETTIYADGKTLEEAIDGVLKIYGSRDKELIKKCRVIDTAAKIRELECEVESADKRLEEEERKADELREGIKKLLNIREHDDDDYWDDDSPSDDDDDETEETPAP